MARDVRFGTFTSEMPTLQSLCHTHSWGSTYHRCRAGYQLRSLLVHQTFKKVLYISPAVRSDFSSGRVFNLVTSDAETLQLLCQNIMGLISSPLRIVVAMAMLYFELGVSSLVAFAVLLLLMPTQVPLRRRIPRPASLTAHIWDVMPILELWLGPGICICASHVCFAVYTAALLCMYQIAACSLQTASQQICTWLPSCCAQGEGRSGCGVQAWLVRQAVRLQKKALLFTDERSKLEGELLNGIDVVKCNSWEVRASHGIVPVPARDFVHITQGRCLRALRHWLDIACTLHCRVA